MTARPRLAVLAVLAAGGAAFGGYYLWPHGRHLVSCAPKHAPVPAAAQAALAGYAHRIQYSVDRSEGGLRSRSWSDPDTGRTREISYSHRRIDTELGIVPDGKRMRTVLVAFHARIWFADSRPAFSRIPNEAAALARATRDKVASGRVTIVGRAFVDGRQTLHLREVMNLPKPALPSGVHVPKALQHSRVLHLDTWVDPLTYLPVRTRTSGGFGWSVSDVAWLPRTPTNVARTVVVIPTGFKHLTRNGGSFTSYTDAVAFRCIRHS